MRWTVLAVMLLAACGGSSRVVPDGGPDPDAGLPDGGGGDAGEELVYVSMNWPISGGCGGGYVMCHAGTWMDAGYLASIEPYYVNPDGGAYYPGDAGNASYQYGCHPQDLSDGGVELSCSAGGPSNSCGASQTWSHTAFMPFTDGGCGWTP